MAPITDFAVEEKYEYLNGFGNHHQSEAFPGSIPPVNNHPLRPPLGTVAEKISGTSFVGPRPYNLHTYLYRANSSYDHALFEPFNHHLATANPSPPRRLTPNSYLWPTFKIAAGDWSQQWLVASNGSAQQKTGIAIWLFNRHAAANGLLELDGEALIVPQRGALDIQTEFGKLLVRQNEIAVIPRGVRYRVTLPDGKGCRGYVLELYQGHFRLPELGIFGSVGLAHARDFQVPTAYFEGSVDTRGESQVAIANNGSGKWTIISRLETKLWSTTQNTTPFNVTGWQGMLYPYKYDLKRFCYIGTINFDHQDPSVYVVLTAPAFGKEPGTAVVDFAVVGPRWVSVEDTLLVPWFHRNTMQEFIIPIIDNQDPMFAPNVTPDFSPFGAWLNGSMVTHGSNREELETWRAKDPSKPTKLQDEGITVGVIETENPLYLADWAMEAAQANFKTQTSIVFKEE